MTAVAERHDETRLDRLVSLSVLAVAILALGMLAVFLGSDSTGDLRNYHYYGGWALLNKQVGFDIAPAQLQTYHHPLLDALFLSVTGTSMSEAVPNIFLFGAIWLVLRGDEAGCAGAG